MHFQGLFLALPKHPGAGPQLCGAAIAQENRRGRAGFPQRPSEAGGPSGICTGGLLGFSFSSEQTGLFVVASLIEDG